MTVSVSCVNGTGKPKARYVSEEAARRALKHSPRWRRRGTWPKPYFCEGCHAWHLGHPAA